VPPSDPDAADSDVPEHLRVLYLTTLQEANLSPTLASNFRDLSWPVKTFLLGHRPTLASATYYSTTLILGMLPPSGNHLVDLLGLRHS